MEANVGRVAEVMGDKVAGFNRNTVMGGREVGPGGKVGADDVEGVMDVDTEGEFVGVVAEKVWLL